MSCHGIEKAVRRMTAEAAVLILLAVSLTGWSLPARAAYSARYLNPVCYQNECDENAAKAQCEDELRLAKADPALAATAPHLYCHRHPDPANPNWIGNKYHIGYMNFPIPETEDQYYLNEYQSTFPYVTDALRPGPNAGCPSGCPLPSAPQDFGDPVNAATGNKYETLSVFSGAGSFPLSLSLTYNSVRVNFYSAVKFNIFGRNRTHSYFRRVDYFAGGGTPAAYVSRPDGKEWRFLPSGSAWVTDRPGVGTLTAITSGSTITGWQFEDAGGGKEIYDASGKLLELYDRAGFKQTLTYDGSDNLQSVTDPNGRILSFTYGANGLVSSVTLPDGSSVGYQYSTGGDLTQIDYPGGTNRQFLYDEAAYVPGSAPKGVLTGEIDESSQRISTTTYTTSAFSRNPQATNTVMAGGVDSQTATYAWADSARSYANTATVTLPLGATRQLGFSRIKDVYLVTSSTTSCSGCTTQVESYTYDANGVRDVVTRNGVTTDYDYDARGLETQRIEAANDTTGSKRTIQTTWNPTFRVPDERRTYDAAGTLKAKTTWTYNSRGQVLTVTQTDPSVTPNTTRVTTYTYCEQADVTAGTCPLVGLLVSVNGARTDVSDITTYIYKPNDPPGCFPTSTDCSYRMGDLSRITNAVGKYTDYVSYDGAGRPTTVIDENGVVTNLEYDARGRLTARKVRGTDNAVETDDLITRIEYWPTGMVKKVTQPDGGFTSFTYDAAQRLTGIGDNAGNSITYTLNAIGQRTQEDTKDPSAVLRRTLSRTYNTLGQLQTLTDAYTRNTGFTYDANGNLDQTTDALSRVADNNYDPLNRLSRTLQDMNGIAAETKFTYDALDNLLQVNDPKLLNTSYTYNGFRDLKQLVSPDTGTTNYTYDSAGNRASQTDARGKVTNYTYDALNRLTGITYPTATTLNTTYTWDTTQAACPAGETFTVGRLAKVVDGSGNTVYCYDRFGHVVRKVQTTNALVFTLRYTWNASGQLTSTIHPDNSVVDYVRNDPQGRITEIGYTRSGGTRQVVITGVTYHPFGPAASWRYGSSTGRLLNRTLNQNYQPGIVQDTTAGGLSVGYEFDEVGNLKKLRDGNQAEPPQRIYGYDALNRLTQTQDGGTLAVLQGYAYDKTGNRTSATVSGTTTTYTYPAGSHKLSSVGANGRSYDANGNTTQAVGTVTKNFVYGDHNRMTQTKDGTTVKMNYVYNGRGEQVRRYLGTANTYTLYDEAGHWLADYTNATTPVQQAIWFGDMPVGVFTGAGASQKLYHVEPDALGTPRVVIDPTRGATGTTVWKWDLNGEAFGTTAPNQDPDGDATQFVFNLRFPGQRYDSASGLNYNYFRDYEAATGRYVESDPIGLRGGSATYPYAVSKPLVNSDPLGLETWCGMPDGTVGPCAAKPPSGESAYIGWEFFFPNRGRPGFGGGQTWLSCTDECGVPHLYKYTKICSSAFPGAGIAFGKVSGMSGKNCKHPERYAGPFAEFGYTFPILIGVGGDIGLSDEGRPTGVNEAGSGVGIPGPKISYCYYVLSSGK